MTRFLSNASFAIKFSYQLPNGLPIDRTSWVWKFQMLNRYSSRALELGKLITCNPLLYGGETFRT